MNIEKFVNTHFTILKIFTTQNSNAKLIFPPCNIIDYIKFLLVTQDHSTKIIRKVFKTLKL